MTWLENGKGVINADAITRELGVLLSSLGKSCKEMSVQETKQVYTGSLLPTKVYLDQPNRSQKVMLKTWRYIWSQAILNAASQRNIGLSRVVPRLNLKCLLETLPLQTGGRALSSPNVSSCLSAAAIQKISGGFHYHQWTVPNQV